MAKKQKMDKSIWYGLGVIVIIIIAVVLLRSGGEAPVETPQDEVDTEEPEVIDVAPEEDEVEAEEEVVAEGTSMEVFECDETVQLGYMPGSCMELANGDIEVGVKNSGRGDLEGLWFYIYDGSNNLVGEDSEIKALSMGADDTYEVPMGSMSGAYKVEIVPIAKVDGKNKICANKKLLVPLSSCT